MPGLMKVWNSPPPTSSYGSDSSASSDSNDSSDTSDTSYTNCVTKFLSLKYCD